MHEATKDNKCHSEWFYPYVDYFNVRCINWLHADFILTSLSQSAVIADVNVAINFICFGAVTFNNASLNSLLDITLQLNSVMAVHFQELIPVRYNQYLWIPLQHVPLLYGPKYHKTT